MYHLTEKVLTEFYKILSKLRALHHPAARQFCRSTYTITDITINSAVRSTQLPASRLHI
jgi:hypothetical protein